MTEPESPWPPLEQSPADIESASDIWEERISNHSFSGINDNFNVDIWEDIHEIPPHKDVRTWENLGVPETVKEPPFLSESNEAVLHLAKLKQAGIMPLLSDQTLLSAPLITEISSLTFLKDIKLLLLGVESNSFCYNSLVILKRNFFYF